MLRWFLFLITLILGALAGLYYGWVIRPAEYVNTSPNTMRIDYKTDYVLMVAEVYSTESDLDQAARRLALLGDATPAETVANAIQWATSNGYADPDLTLMQKLAADLQNWKPVRETPTP